MRLAAVSNLLVLLFIVSACEKKAYIQQEKIVGIWKSVHTTTDLYDGDRVTESFELKSDKYSFSVLEFDENGSFKSYGQYKADGADTTHIVSFETQQGIYRIQEHTLITKIDGFDKEAEMSLAFDTNNYLTVRSSPMKINQTDMEKHAVYFTSTVSYAKVP